MPQGIPQPRYRRPCTGELIQIDGCDHDWFEGRGPACTALVYVDDATSKLMELLFVKSESTFFLLRSHAALYR
uniref:Mobile element protein n=1 Tax=Klebsiella pneumoniae TaxID=573 RepID=A0A8B0SVV6_KLEPN|nr:Mobile element protein [Klebsiella pneumoniae]